MIYDENKKLTVINLYAGPGTGKTATSMGLASLLKKKHVEVELVTEWIKDEGIWEQRENLFTEQEYIFAHQHRKLRRLVKHDLDCAITDSPLILSLMYLPPDYPETFAPFVKQVYETYNNINIFLVRNTDVKYQQKGRNQDLQQAIEKDQQIKNYLDVNGIIYYTVNVDENVEQNCYDIIQTHQQTQRYNPDLCNQW